MKYNLYMTLRGPGGITEAPNTHNPVEAENIQAALTGFANGLPKVTPLVELVGVRLIQADLDHTGDEIEQQSSRNYREGDVITETYVRIGGQDNERCPHCEAKINYEGDYWPTSQGNFCNRSHYIKFVIKSPLFSTENSEEGFGPQP